MITIMRTFVTLAAVTLLIAVAPAAAGARIEKELELGSGGRFVLDTDNGALVITGTDRTGARIVITSRAEDIEDLYDIEFWSRPGEVEVNVDRKRKGIASWFGWRRKFLHFEIEVPRETDIDIHTSGGTIRAESVHGTARLNTSGGSIRAVGIAGELIAKTSGGNIVIEDVDGLVNVHTSGGRIKVEDVRGNLRADTSGGRIEAQAITGDVSADTSGGRIHISEAGGRVNAHTSGGSVTVSFTSGNSRGGRLSTSGGGIRVHLDPSADLFIDAKASGGSVTANIPVTVRGKLSRYKLNGKIGSGGETLVLRTSGGSIHIEPL